MNSGRLQAEIAEEAAKLWEAKIKTSLFEGQLAEELGPLLRGARQLPAFLEAFSIFLGQIVDNSVGKRGHKGRKSHETTSSLLLQN